MTQALENSNNTTLTLISSKISPYFSSSVFRFALLSMLCVYANTEEKAKKIVVIDSQTGFPYEDVKKSMLAELSARGFTKSAGFVQEYYSLAQYKGAAKNLWQHRIKNSNFDVIFLNGTLAVSSFKDIAWQSPAHFFVYANVTDPVGLGVISEHGKAPLGNFTGIAFQVPIEIRMDFLRRLIPNVKNIGLVYADMPQSHSYRRWLEKEFQKKEWEGVTLHFRKVGFTPSEGGHRRMAKMAKRYIQELDPIVDVFLSPSDQMGVQKPFVSMVANTATKPLIGLGINDVEWGAAATIYADLDNVGRQAAHMIERILNGEAVKTILPKLPIKYGTTINKTRAKMFHLDIRAASRPNTEIIE